MVLKYQIEIKARMSLSAVRFNCPLTICGTLCLRSDNKSLRQVTGALPDFFIIIIFYDHFCNPEKKT